MQSLDHVSDHPGKQERLHSGSRGIPVIPVHRQLAAYPSDLSNDGWPVWRPGNHQYDIHDFFDAINAGNYPQVSFLKAPGYQEGHPGYSDPIDEQKFIVDVINFLAQLPD